MQEASARLLADMKGKEAYIERWFYRTIRNLHIDQVRKNSVAARHQGRIAGCESSYLDGGKVVETLLTLDSAKSALFELPDEQRTVLMLVGVEGFSYREAADILDLPIGTVTSRLARARSRMVRMVKGDCVVEGEAEVQSI